MEDVEFNRSHAVEIRRMAVEGMKWRETSSIAAPGEARRVVDFD